jgi:hypothetical protein
MRRAVVISGIISAMVACGAAAAAAQDVPHSRPFDLTIAGGRDLRPDGKGTYRTNAGYGSIWIGLCGNAPWCSTRPEPGRQATKSRDLLLDLSHPVPNSGAIPRGVVRTSLARWLVFWRVDTIGMVRSEGVDYPTFMAAVDIPLDSTVPSDEVQIRFYGDSAEQMLQFGPGMARRTRWTVDGINGVGTVAASIAHLATSTWVVRSGEESVGRLWDISDSTKPVDRGLYRFSFEGRFDELPASVESSEESTQQRIGLALLVFFLFVAPPAFGWLAGRLIRGRYGMIVGAAVPVVGWGIYLVRAYAGPSDYGLNQTLGPIITLVVCTWVGILGGRVAAKAGRTKQG